MIEIKTLNGKLNKDDSEYRLPKDDYTDALNITKDAVEGSNDQVVTNIVANRIGDVNFTLPSGRNVCIGAYSNTLRSTIIQFIWNENSYHQILEYDIVERVQSVIFENLTDSGGEDILGFTEFDKITSVNIYHRDEGDLLMFLDSLGRPTYMDITAFKAGTYTPVTRSIINLATRPPLAPPQGVYDNDTTQNVNYLINKFFRFKYIWVYDDNRKSTTSPISEVLIPIGFLDTTTTSDQTNNNVITLSLNSGDKDVKSVQVLMSYVEKSNNWSDFLIVDTLDKTKLSIDDNEVFSYSFYNDSTYPVLDINESILLFDYVPQRANAQELANGNVLVFGGITEGYDNDLVANVVNVVSTYPISSPTSGNLTSSSTYEGDNFFTYQARSIFAGVPFVGTVVEITVRKISDGLYYTGASYTTVAGDTFASVVTGLVASLGTYGIFTLSSQNPAGGRITYTWLKAVFNKDIIVNITAASSALSDNSIPVWKWSSQRNEGLAYFDENGKTNGVVYNDKITFPAYLEDISGNVYLPTINTKIYHRPPTWAHSFQFLFTKDNTYFLFWATNSINLTETDYIYLEVTDFDTNAVKFPTTITNLSYTFQDGDRMRLIKPIGTFLFYGDDLDAAILGLVVEPKINGVVQTGKKFIKINKTLPFTNSTFTGYDNYVIEIYRPSQQSAGNENQVYYECGRQYDVLNPGTPERVHAGEVTNQSEDLATPAEFNFTKGGSYYRQRVIALNDTTTILFNVQDLNIIDNYASAVNSIDGRPNIIDINAKQAYYSTLVRFGQAYQPNTNINGLNRFFPANFDEYDYTYGDIQRFVSRDRYIRVFQKYKIGSVPLFNQISKNADGTQLLVVTDKLLNPIQYYAGNFGIGNCKESLASFNFADYGCDDIRGVVWRVSNDGITPISVVYKINSWASQELPLRTGDKKVYGVFDQRLNNYIAALDAVLCEGVVVPSFSLNNATAGIAFSQTVTLTGSLYFTLSNIVKPAWMSIIVAGYDIIFSGTPTSSDEGTSIPVTFDVSNDCGEVSVSKTIDVVLAACIGVGITGSPVLPDGGVGFAYSYSFAITGTAPFVLANVVKPSWMTIAISGLSVVFSGTPDASGTAIPVSFDITNCSASIVSFSDTIDVFADPTTSTLTFVQYASGVFYFTLSNAIYSTGFDITLAYVDGATTGDCSGGYTETDQLTLGTFPSGATAQSFAGDDPMSCSVNSYRRRGNFYINGVQKFDGDTITIGSTLVTVSIDSSCNGSYAC